MCPAMVGMVVMPLTVGDIAAYYAGTGVTPMYLMVLFLQVLVF